MNREAKSLINSLIVILFYYFALVGIVKLFWNTQSENQFDGRVKFLGLLLILLTIVGVIVPYHLFSIGVVDIIYQVIIAGHLLLLIVGGCSYAFMK